MNNFKKLGGKPDLKKCAAGVSLQIRIELVLFIHIMYVLCADYVPVTTEFVDWTTPSGVKIYI